MNLKRRSHNYCSCDCEESECNLCEGSLYYCLVCGGVETDSLTKDCCGRMISDIEEEKISKGWLGNFCRYLGNISICIKFSF